VDWAVLAPLVVLAVGVVAVLLAVSAAGPRPRGALAGLPLWLAVATAGGAGAAALLAWPGAGRGTFCTASVTLPGGVRVGPSCSYAADRTTLVFTVLFCLAGLCVLLLAAGSAPVPGEQPFLLVCSLTGAVSLAGARDLLTLVVAVETLTLPLYVLVGLRASRHGGGGGPGSGPAETAVRYLLQSVAASAVTLLGVALLYGITGAVHLDRVRAALAAGGQVRGEGLAGAAVVLVLVGLLFKTAAVPFHAWAPGTYDGSPLPIAAYLATASKTGGVLAVVLVAVGALRPWLDVVGPVLAVVAALTMTVGNLAALRQRRLVRLLAWSSVAQAGYLLAPLGVAASAGGRADDAALRGAVAATVAYTALYVVITLGAFAAVVAARPAGAGGGTIDGLRGLARRAPWTAACLVLALAGLAGLPPGLAGLFAKVAVVRALLDGGAGWLALVVAANTVLGLAYYLRVAAVLFAEPTGTGAPPARGPAVRRPVLAGLALPTVLALAAGFVPQVVLSASVLEILGT